MPEPRVNFGIIELFYKDKDAFVMLIGGCNKRDILYDSTEIFDCVNAKFWKGPVLSKPKD